MQNPTMKERADSAKQRLRSLFQKSIDLGSKGFRQLEKPWTQNPPVRRITNYLEYMLRVIPFNPWNKPQLEYLLAIYVPARWHQKNGYATKKRHDEEQKSDARKSIFELVHTSDGLTYLLAPRGGGKTITINSFLAKYWNRLQTAGIAMFRVDCAKLISANSDLAAADRIPIEDYVYMHSILVFYRYGIEHVSNEGNADQCFSVAAREVILQAKWSDSEKALWTFIIERYAKLKQIGRTVSAMSVEILRSFSGNQSLIGLQLPAPFVLRDLFVRITGDLRSPETKKRVLVIIDGLDNVIKHLDDSQYQSNIKSIRSLITPNVRSVLCNHMIVALRDETLPDVVTGKGALPSNEEIFQPHHIILNQPSVHELLSKRLRAALKSESRYAKAARAKFGVRQKECRQTHDSITTFSKDFLDRIVAGTRLFRNSGDYPTRTACSARDFAAAQALEAVFGGNIRSFVRCLCRGHEYGDVFAKPTLGVVLPERLKRRVVTEGIILAGCKFFPTNNSPDVHGRWCPNLFEWTATDYQDTWNGLATTRLLQIANSGRSISVGFAVNELNQLFGYNRALTLKLVKWAISTRLLCYSGTVIARCLENSLKSTEEAGVTISPKGRFMLDWVYRSGTAMYLMGLTALLPARLIGFRSSKFVHDPDRVIDDRRYTLPRVLTLFVLSWSIRIAHEVEMQRMTKEALAKARLRKEQFPLPDLFRTMSEVLKLIDGLREGAMKDLETIIDYWEGLRDVQSATSNS